MERRRTDREIADLTQGLRAQADLKPMDQSHSVGGPANFSPAPYRTYDPAVSSQAMRAEAEARYGLMEPIDAGADAVERGLARLDRLNALLSTTGYVDPAMVELKEEYQRGMLYRLRRYMRPDAGAVEESLSIEARHRRQQY